MSSPPQSFSVPFSPLLTELGNIDNLARSANQAWFGTAITPTLEAGQARYLQIQFCYSVRTRIEVSVDGGTTWCTTNNFFRYQAETLISLSVLMHDGDTLDVRADTAGTIRHARVAE